MILDISDVSLVNPINISNFNFFVAFLNCQVARDNKSEVSFGEFFLGEGGELVESLFVGLGWVGVVGVDFGEVLEEDSLSVSILELRRIADAVFGFPGLEF